MMRRFMFPAWMPARCPAISPSRAPVSFLCNISHTAVFVHCRAGVSRSASMVLAYLLADQTAAINSEAEALDKEHKESEGKDEFPGAAADGKGGKAAGDCGDGSGADFKADTAAASSDGSASSKEGGSSSDGKEEQHESKQQDQEQQLSAALAAVQTHGARPLLFDRAFAWLQRRRPRVLPNDGFRAQLLQWMRRLDLERAAGS